MFFSNSNILLSLTFLKIPSFRASPSFWHILRKGKFGEVCSNCHEIPLRPTQGIDKLSKFLLVTITGICQLSLNLALHETTGRTTEAQKSSK
jgi:hypothetical protein